jgi:hypothetical protein
MVAGIVMGHEAQRRHAGGAFAISAPAYASQGSPESHRTPRIVHGQAIGG